MERLRMRYMGAGGAAVSSSLSSAIVGILAAARPREVLARGTGTVSSSSDITMTLSSLRELPATVLRTARAYVRRTGSASSVSLSSMTASSPRPGARRAGGRVADGLRTAGPRRPPARRDRAAGQGRRARRRRRAGDLAGRRDGGQRRHRECPAFPLLPTASWANTRRGCVIARNDGGCLNLERSTPP